MIRLYVAASLDGYIADDDGSVGWLDAFHTPEASASYHSFIKEIGAIVTGRVTFEQALTLGPWPHDKIRTVVISSRELTDLPANTEVIAVGELERVVAELRELDRDTWILGGGRTVQALLALGAIDQFELFVIPLLFGSGIPLFPKGCAAAELELVETKAMSRGMALLRYSVVKSHPDSGSRSADSD